MSRTISLFALVVHCVLDVENTPLRICANANVGNLLGHIHHDALILWAPNEGRENAFKSIISNKNTKLPSSNLQGIRYKIHTKQKGKGIKNNTNYNTSPNTTTPH